MFDLTLPDHLRLMFSHVVDRHRAHAGIAASRGRWSRRLRATEAVLIAAMFAASIAAAFGSGRVFAVLSASVAGVTLVIFLLRVMLDVEGSARAHGECASRLWELQERYRAVLSDLTESAIDPTTARQRRDVLMTELHAIYRDALRVDPQAYLKIGGEEPGANAYQPAA